MAYIWIIQNGESNEEDDHRVIVKDYLCVKQLSYLIRNLTI